MEKGYKISLGKNRTSVILTNNSSQILTQFQQPQIKYFTRDGSPYSTTRTFPGPDPHLRLVTVVRNITGGQLLNYFGIYLINLSEGEKNNVSHQILYERVSDKSKEIRNIVFSPNRKQLIIIYDQFVEKHEIKLKTDEKDMYNIRKTQEVAQSSLKQSIGAVYDPSGQHIYGLRYEKIKSPNQTRKYLYLYKLTTRNLTYSESLVTCSYSQNYSFMSPWVLEMSIKQDIGVFATYLNGSACLFETSPLSTHKTDHDPNAIPNIYELHTNSTQTSSYNFSDFNSWRSLSVGTLMIKNKPQFVFYNSANMGHYFDPTLISATNNLFQVISPTNNNTGQIKCIDIQQIDAFACIKNGLSSVFVNKIINNNKDPIYVQRLLEINNDQPKDLLIQDIFYNQLTNQLCYYISNQIKCSQILVQCTSNSTLFFQPNICDKNCKNDLNTFWSPVSFKCQKCSVPQCKCKPSQQFVPQFNPQFDPQFDPNLNQCAFSCSPIPKAVPGSQYYKSAPGDNNKQIYYKAKCVCQPPYMWFDDLKRCRLDCSLIEKNNAISYDKLKIDECECIKKYRFVKDERNPNGGLCQYVCPNSELAVQINNKNICKCDKNQIWNANLQKCVSQIQKQAQIHGTPAWAIILIVVSSLIVLGVILYCIWKKWKGKNGKLISQRSSITSQDTDRNKMPTTQNIKNEKNEQQLCVICKSQQDTNCKGLCNHSYHFQCINNEIIEGKNFCPACFKQFPKGISDLIIVDKKQVFSIGDDNDQNQ